MDDRPTLRLRLTPDQYLKIAAATGLLVDELELEMAPLPDAAKPQIRLHRLRARIEPPVRR